MKTELDTLCKYYELRENQKLLKGLPIVIRIDGKTFHNFTKGMVRPFDSRFTNLMGLTLKYLMGETSAVFGYTQSDEISLLLWNPTGDIYFSGKPYKINSVLASKCTLFFNKNLKSVGLEKFAPKEPVFDCRCWAVPNNVVYDTFRWRYIDAIRNSVSMLAQSVFSHKELNKKSVRDMHEMLFQKGINWAHQPDCFKNGQFMIKRKEQISFSPDELESLPEHHAALKNPDLKIIRNTIKPISIKTWKGLEESIKEVLV